MALLPDAWSPPAPFVEAVEASARPEGRDTAVPRDEAVLAALYAEHAPGILRFLRDMLGCAAAADDATQETFVRAFRRLSTLRDGTRPAAWLFGIARNVSLEMRRARRVRDRVIVRRTDEAPPEAPDRRTPEAELIGREAARVAERALGRLSEERRAMLLLRLDHDLSYEEIALAMGCSVAKAKVEVHRARQTLRDEMDAYEGGRR